MRQRLKRLHAGREKAAKQIVSRIDEDLRLMRGVRARLQKLTSRDSNCGTAACYCDAALLLMKEAERLHQIERKDFLKYIRRPA